ncbi:cobalamin B12-binding domain-containing protein [Rhodospira trueperi]|nr:cobalamin B12-binding domain-containing protein [Rhodospira trueperi]
MPHGPLRGDRRIPAAIGAWDAGIRAHGCQHADDSPTANDIEAFAQFILNDDMGLALAVAESWLARGASFEDICADLLQPAACVLEAYCAGDACDFADLTLGLGRLQWVLHDLDRMCGADDRLYGLDRRILLVAAPGEGHTFGVSMLSAVFHRAGWDVTDALVVDSADELIGFVGDTSYPVVGLWVGARGCLAGLRNTIDALRRTSINPNLRVLVAGPRFRGDTLDEGGHGADALAATAPAAVLRAERLLDASLEHN